ncbi:MAG: cyclic nucleotide-binding domain-containing protein [Polyangiaceae bacterium]|nr:cyclic nucleotide-binding domain-containing protein [Polyangiaceae bacterium]
MHWLVDRSATVNRRDDPRPHPNPIASMPLLAVSSPPAELSTRLGRIPALASLSGEDLARIAARCAIIEVPTGATIAHEGAPDRSAFLILAGTARLERQGEEIGTLGEGDHLGELSLLALRDRSSTVVAQSPMTLARLDREGYDAIASATPVLALSLWERLLAGTTARLVEEVESSALLLRGRSLPRRSVLRVRTPDGPREVRLGTTVGELLPREVAGRDVVAGLVDHKAVSLSAHVTSDSDLGVLTTSDLDGQRYYRNSQALLLLEAASRVAPEARVRMSHSIGMGQRVTVEGLGDGDLEEFAANVEAAMHSLVTNDRPLLEEWWTVDETRAHFAAAGWDAAVALLEVWREPAVPLVSYGNLYALNPGPLLPSTGRIDGFQVVADGAGLLLMYGQDAAPRSIPPPAATPGVARPADRNPLTREALATSHLTAVMTAEHDRWLRALGITSVGAFNAACIAGQVTQLIHVSEGFQEKSIGHIADAILENRARARVVCIAGPSSAGKTTFIKRLEVQLQINGINPVPVSLDDYYVDRDQTPRDAAGEYDFEALDALQLPLLHDHVARLLAGEEVVTAHYDFLSGTSHPAGGRRIQLRPTDLLMLEGIHGLNPRMLAPEMTGAVFRVFVCPLAALPFDRLARVHASDVRLIRRIVRDRHTRGHDATESILRWPSVRAGERRNIFAYQHHADAVFDSSLIYELAVLKVYAEGYLLEVPRSHRAQATAFRLLQLLDRFVTILPEHVPRLSILREFIGKSGFKY